MTNDQLFERASQFCYEHRDCNPNGPVVQASLRALLARVRDDAFELGCAQTCRERDALRARAEAADLRADEGWSRFSHAERERDELRAQVAILRAALDKVDDGACSSGYGPGCDGDCQWVARGALREADELCSATPQADQEKG